MPTGITHTPGRFPLHNVFFRRFFPQSEVGGVAFFVVDLDARARDLVFEIKPREFAVVLKLGNIEINAVARFVAVPQFHEFLNVLDHVLNVVGGFGDNFGLADIERRDILKENVGVVSRDFIRRFLLFLRREFHLVFAGIAVGEKMTYVGYRKDKAHINGMTLGAFTGYFRERASLKNITHPYADYKAHIVLGVIYSPVKGIDERRCYSLDQLDQIISVVKDFDFFVQEKWKIAIDRPGSGNTKNIGSVNRIDDLLNGNGPFAALGEEMFDDYWTHYLTNDMAKAAELTEPYYKNLPEYKRFKNIE